MSLKAIELQVALPRTVDAGRVQEQLTQKSNLDQQQLAMMSQSEQEHNRIRSTPLIPTNEPLAIHQHNERDTPAKKNRLQHKKNEEDEKNEAKHPYKGKHIDLSL